MDWEDNVTSSSQVFCVQEWCVGQRLLKLEWQKLWLLTEHSWYLPMCKRHVWAGEHTVHLLHSTLEQ